MISRQRISLLFIVLCLSVIPAHAQVSGQPRVDEALSRYKQELKSALLEGMSEGVVQAIDVCRVKAPGIAESLSQDGILIGRSSHRLRNPGNAPPDWVEPILSSYVANPADREPRTALLPEGRSGYVEPILLQPLCTACHGEVISAEVAAQIDELYPDDQAVGFSVGDLRGVFWVEYPTVN